MTWVRHDEQRSQSETVTETTLDSKKVPDSTDSSVEPNGRATETDSHSPTARRQTRSFKSGNRSRDHDKKNIQNKGPRNFRRSITVLQTCRVSDFYRNADNRPIT